MALVLLFSGCATGTYVTSEDIVRGNVKDNSVCLISENWDLKGESVTIPTNCTLSFKKGSYVYNGTINGNNTKIKYDAPFIGEAITLNGCEIIGKKVIRDTDVFVNVRHTQKEIQTLFDISKGVKVIFSKGVYKDIERIVINNNIDADFSNSTIQLYHDKSYVAECFYMDPWVDINIDYFRIKNLTIKGKRSGFKGSNRHRSCIQLFYVSEVVFDSIFIDEFYGGPDDLPSNPLDIFHKKLYGTSAINIFNYDKCIINRCKTHNISKEIFWCVPNTSPDNITFFTNNTSTCSLNNGSASFLNLIDGRCVVNNNKVYNYNGSAFNAFCYDSEISNNSFYNGKRSVAIDLSEGTMYKARNVYVHDNECENTKGLVAVYGERIRIENNQWINSIEQTGKRLFVIAIRTRGERVSGIQYIECDNNPELASGTNNITITNNYLLNKCEDNEIDIRCAIIYGDKVAFKNNHIIGFNRPVVQYVEGTNIDFSSNIIINSINGNNAAFLVEKGNNIIVKNNHFDYNCTKGEREFTIQIKTAEGYLKYCGNKINNVSESSSDTIIYTPCLINDDSELTEVELFVENPKDIFRMSTGLKSNKVVLKTNIKN